MPKIPAAACCSPCSEARRRTPASTAPPSIQRHLHVRHRAAVRHRRHRPSSASPPPAAPALRVVPGHALSDLLLDLAVQVVRDGEGAHQAHPGGCAPAPPAGKLRPPHRTWPSPTRPWSRPPLPASDANWGRMRHGGRQVRRTRRPRPSLHRRSAAPGWRATAPSWTGYDETPVVAHMRGREIADSGRSATRPPATATAWTCDLTHGYIDINGSYRS